MPLEILKGSYTCFQALLASVHEQSNWQRNQAGGTHVCTSGDPERALHLASAPLVTVKDHSSLLRDLAIDMPIYASRTRWQRTWNSHGAWSRASPACPGTHPVIRKQSSQGPGESYICYTSGNRPTAWGPNYGPQSAHLSQHHLTEQNTGGSSIYPVTRHDPHPLKTLVTRCQPPISLHTSDSLITSSNPAQLWFWRWSLWPEE